MSCEVEISDRPDPAAAPALAWEEVRAALDEDPAQDDLRAARMAEPSTLVPWSEAARAYAAPSLGAGGATGSSPSPTLMRRIHREFEFEPGATTVTTSVDEVLDAAPRRLPGFRPRDDRVPAQLRPAGALRLGLPPHASRRRGGRGCSAPTSRTPGSRRTRRATAGSSSIRPTTISPTTATSRSRAAPTSPMSCRCAA